MISQVGERRFTPPALPLWASITSGGPSQPERFIQIKVDKPHLARARFGASGDRVGSGLMRRSLLSSAAARFNAPVHTETQHTTGWRHRNRD